MFIVMHQTSLFVMPCAHSWENVPAVPQQNAYSSILNSIDGECAGRRFYCALAHERFYEDFFLVDRENVHSKPPKALLTYFQSDNVRRFQRLIGLVINVRG